MLLLSPLLGGVNLEKVPTEAEHRVEQNLLCPVLPPLRSKNEKGEELEGFCLVLCLQNEPQEEGL